MHRIDTSTAQKDKFGTGKNGFTGGNPQTGELATALDADYFDDIQEEICSVIEAAGINLAKGTRNQLLSAMQALTPGRLLNIQVFTSSRQYIPTPGTTNPIAEVLGAGGGAGSNANTSGSSSSVSAAAGGGAGSYAMAKISAQPSTVIVGNGGVGGASTSSTSSGVAGSAGGSSSIGGIVAPGGAGGGAGNSIVSLPAAGNTTAYSDAPTGTGLLFGFKGDIGIRPIAYSTTAVVSGGGGKSIFGPATDGRYAQSSSPSVAGYDAFGYGCGGSGSASIGGTGAVSAKGGNGGSGLVIVWEYA